mgnify:CR=1 FL=1
MKHFVLLLILSFSTILSSQEKDIEKRFLDAIKKSNAVQKLVLMDSLSNYIAYDTNFKNDSIIRKTIALAKELDSFDIVVRQTSNLLNY